MNIIKRLSLPLILAMLLCSCGNPDKETGISTSIELSESSAICIEERNINPLNITLSFETVVEKWEEVTELDIISLSLTNEPNYYWEDENDYYYYIRDYSAFIDEESEPDDMGQVRYYPTESEFHQIQRLEVDGFGINEFENETWAYYDYCTRVDSILSNCNELDESSYENGYLFVVDEPMLNIRRFCAVYYWGNFTLTYYYDFDSYDINSYQNYCEMADALGLPTCDQITESILD